VVDHPHVGYYRQKITYCTAAREADDVIDYLEWGSAFYSIAASICAGACVTYLCSANPGCAAAHGPLNTACTAAGIAAGGADMIWNMTLQSSYQDDLKNISSAIAPAAGAANLLGSSLGGGNLAAGSATEGGKSHDTSGGW